ncbi:pancreatic triacylglycerol lipase-like isoform X2 [Neodiprion pinetum]|uniref:pancreatic triacylglycerol lipase-like isoform X2 n=1 Tax=Neodiprion pinetum TaxID=441929 RepID=UPI001EDE93E0|nr:pancreatic triacylglycerol lipase-like isoform X2 [Neodiprion pinetum]
MRKYAKYYINICSTVAGRKVLISPKTSSHDEDESDDIASRSYAERGDHNVLAVDYGDIAAMSWAFAFRSFEGILYQLIRTLNQLVDGGLIPTTLHIVGHSYGAQIAGNIGRNVNFVVPKIVALDAAYPRFSETEVHSLRKTDAEFVLVIHTEAGIFGITYPAGHVDFFPNRGESPQPGCELTEGGATARITEIVCSHQRSCSFYGESLRNTDAFYGRACDSYEEFEAGLCSSNATVVMGYETPTTARGTFTLQTNSASPYGRGISGATYEA